MDILAILQENQEIVLLVSTGLIGIVIGFLMGRSGGSTRVDAAVEKVRKEAEEEKLDISRDLNTELLKVRDSIVQTVNAYTAVTKTIQDKLPIPPELQAIEGEANTQIRLEIDTTDAEANADANELRSVEDETTEDSGEQISLSEDRSDSSEDLELSESEEPLSPSSQSEKFEEGEEFEDAFEELDGDNSEEKSAVSEPVRINA